MGILYERNSRCNGIALVLVVVTLVGFVGYVGWSVFSWVSSFDSFLESLRKDGFTIIEAHGGTTFERSFMWLPPQNVFTCQNQTQFIDEAYSLNVTGGFSAGDIYEVDIFHFYAVTSDTVSGYEYTPPYPIFMYPLDAILSNALLVVVVFYFGAIFFAIAIGVLLLISKTIARKRKREKDKSLPSTFCVYPAYFENFLGRLKIIIRSFS